MNSPIYNQSNKLDTSRTMCGPDKNLEEHKQEYIVKLTTNTRRVGDRTIFLSIAPKSRVSS